MTIGGKGGENRKKKMLLAKVLAELALPLKTSREEGEM